MKKMHTKIQNILINITKLYVKLIFIIMNYRKNLKNIKMHIYCISAFYILKPIKKIKINLFFIFFIDKF